MKQDYYAIYVKHTEYNLQTSVLLCAFPSFDNLKNQCQYITEYVNKLKSRVDKNVITLVKNKYVLKNMRIRIYITKSDFFIICYEITNNKESEYYRINGLDD